MKQIYFSIILIIVVFLPQALVGQQRPAELPQTQSVTFMVKDGDSVVPKSVDVTYSPKQEQDKLPLPYDQAPEAKTTVQPKYPDGATKAGTEGTVWTKVFINESGRVTKVTIQKSDAEIFNQPSIDAAMQWVFKPALKAGKPVACEVAIPFKFKMMGKGSEGTDYTMPGLTGLTVLAEPRGGYRIMRQAPYLIGQSPSRSNNWYPESAQKDRFEGNVILKLTINTGGRVERVEIVSHAREDLDSAAVSLARTWTFIPGQFSGMPERAIIHVPVGFYLERQSK
jgi:TonB family protein